ncbi:MAG TPA: glycosyltransferase family 39 protein, partial [archaeon]|nr:glycosyltransferase family 39 protein [archaeon]
MSKFQISHLLLLSLALHLFVIPFPQDGFIFDEVYYVPAAEKALLLQPANTEQNPLAKIMIAISIKIFGDYWFAWRFPIVLTGIVSLYAFYLIAKHFMNERYALFATAMLSFDVIFFIHGSIFVLDMPSICFGLIGIYLYLIKKYSWSAVSFGISFLMYAVGLLFLGVVIIYHIITHQTFNEFKNKLNQKKLTVFLLVLLLISGGGLWIYDIVYKPTSGTIVYVSVGINKIVDKNGNPVTTQTITQSITKGIVLTNPIENLAFSLNYFATLSPNLNTSAAQYRPPWDWILPIGNSLNPPHYLTVVVTSGAFSQITIDWVSQITPFVEYFLIPIVIIAIIRINRAKYDDKTGPFL